MIKRLKYGVLLLALVVWFSLVWCLSGKTPIQPYNGDVMSERIPDVCEKVVETYLGPPDPSAHHLTSRQVSLDTYMAMRRAYEKCVSEARINVH